MRIWNVTQGTQEWAEARRGKATASRFGDIITDKKADFSPTGARSYACELLAEKIVPPHYWVSNDYASGPMQHGTNKEQEARAYFEFITGRTCQEVGFISTDDDFMGASPDSLICADDGLELKCPLHKTQISYLLNPDELLFKYRAQCHGCMIVSKRTHWNLMSYAVGLPPVVLEFHVDEYTVKLAKALEEFRKIYDDLAAKLGTLDDPIAATREPHESYF